MDIEIVEHSEENPMQKLEDALVLCKFGRFNALLLLTTFFSVLATTSVTTATSYILPSAECDLNMRMIDKGLLVAIPFLGQLSASLFTGFMTDAFGRKLFLVGGNLGLFLSGLIGAFSQSYTMLVLGKLLEGIVMSLVFTATTSMVSELTHRLIRDRVLMTTASLMSLSIIITTSIGWAILPQDKQFVIVKDYFVMNSWNLYLLLCSCWSLLAAALYWQLPESPKFLLSHGSEQQALLVLKKIYHINTRKPENTFPITSLGVSREFKTQTSIVSFKKKFVNGLYDAKALFRFPLLWILILFCSINMICLLAYSALRLWFPQISTIVENYEKGHNGENTQFCIIIDDYTKNLRNLSTKYTLEASIDGSKICVPALSGMETYTNGIILGLISLTSISVTGYFVDFFGQKPLMFVFLIACAALSCSLYWTNSSLQIAIIISATCASVQTVFSLQQNILVRVFPTTVRTMALSIVIMVARIGSLIGNIIFPVMMDLGCMVPFFTLAAVTLCTAGLIYFLPNPQKENQSGDK